MENQINEIILLFPEKIQNIFSKIPNDIKFNINEIRIRSGKPLILNCKNMNLFIDKNARIIDKINHDILIIDKSDILKIFTKMCNYSIYSYQNEIKNGFITLKGGHRVGLCGTAVTDNGMINNIKNISSMNIRISREILNFNIDIYKLIGLNFTGLLIIGPPGSGKTTLLRNLAKCYSTLNEKKLVQVCVIDERGELSGTYLGLAQNDLGYSDILNGYRKSDGINHAIRTLSPDIIICDEILGDDLDYIKHGVNSGVKFIASIHAKNPDELIHKSCFKKLVKLNAFDKFIFLSNKNNPSMIEKVLSVNELLKREKLNC